MYWKGEKMKAAVIQKQCGSVGICVKIAPEVFRFQEGSKKAMVVMDDIPPQYQEQCRKAASKCPNKAIVISR